MATSVPQHVLQMFTSQKDELCTEVEKSSACIWHTQDRTFWMLIQNENTSRIKKASEKHFLNIFICYLAIPELTLTHLWGSSLTNTITVFHTFSTQTYGSLKMKFGFKPSAFEIKCYNTACKALTHQTTLPNDKLCCLHFLVNCCV